MRIGDVIAGAADGAPFDRIVVTAMAQHRLPPTLLDQLAPDGVLVCAPPAPRRIFRAANQAVQGVLQASPGTQPLSGFGPTREVNVA